MIRFGSFELDLLAQELRQKGSPVPLQPQPFKLLLLLATRPGELVSREEIRLQLWGEETFVDYEQGIAYCVREVRRALGDTARSSHFVETVPGRGFRFLAETRREEPRASRQRRTRAPKVRFRVAFALIAILLGTVAVTALWPGDGERPRLAVLPFESLGGGTDEEMQARGLTEELIGWLGRRLKDEVDVLAVDSMYRQREQATGIDEAAELLDADWVVEGTVRTSESGVRVAVRLVQPPHRRTLWSREYDTTLEDPVALQIRLGHEIGQALGAEVLAESSPAPSLESLRVLSEARALRRLYTAEALLEARALLEKSVEREPNAASLWLELGIVLRILGQSDLAIEALETASRLEPLLAEAYGNMAFIQLYSQMDPLAADRNFQRALEINPSLAKAHQLRAFLYSALGRHQDALTSIARARSLDPLSETVLSDSGWIFLFVRRFAEADAYCTESTTTSVKSRWAHVCRVMARSAQGDAAGAWEAARTEMQALGFGQPDDPDLASLAPDEALRRYWQWRLEWLDSLGARTWSPTEMAACHMGLGDHEAALTELDRAFETRRGWERLHLSYHPLYEPLKEYPRFQALLARVAGAQGGPVVFGP